MNPNYYYSFGH